MSDRLVFVIKDEASGTWYDVNGSNYDVRLRAKEDGDGMGDGNGDVVDLDELPMLSQDLCGKWAYIKWLDAGCPQRNEHEQQVEYQGAIKELEKLLRSGTPLQLLEDVADGRQDYLQLIEEKLGQAPPKRPRAVPHDLMST